MVHQIVLYRHRPQIALQEKDGMARTGDKLWRHPAAAAKSEVMKGDKLEKQDGSGSQERNHEGRQA